MNTYLMGEENGQNWVSQYNEEEMKELFTAPERRILQTGAVLVKGKARWVNMTTLAKARLNGVL